MHTYISNTHMHCFKCLSNRLLNSILSTWPKFVQWRKNLVWIPLPPFLFCFEIHSQAVASVVETLIGGVCVCGHVRRFTRSCLAMELWSSS